MLFRRLPRLASVRWGCEARGPYGRLRREERRIGLGGVEEPIDVVIGAVGGTQLMAVYALLAPGGTLLSVDRVSCREAFLPVGSTLGSPVPGTVVSVYDGAGLTDCRVPPTRRLALVKAGRLSVPVGRCGPWDRIAEAVGTLGSRRLRGKAVLDAG
ncbi:zinc-binding dehydrogenase [Streptomyces siamensis]|uniref:Uncharacterized protein n=1 Tax=Streptomyces siamensis TaxID=1274986 RepID=A0ABP9JMR5_9ACTN